MEYICYLKPNQIIEINNFYFKVKDIKSIYKTKRRYEQSIWYPKGAGYDSYKLSLINLLTEKDINHIYSAETQFKIINPTITKYYVVGINDKIITLLTEDFVETNMNVSDIDINTNIKINKYINDVNIGEIIITIYVLKELNILKIINLQTLHNSDIFKI